MASKITRLSSKTLGGNNMLGNGNNNNNNVISGVGQGSQQFGKQRLRGVLEDISNRAGGVQGPLGGVGSKGPMTKPQKSSVIVIDTENLPTGCVPAISDAEPLDEVDLDDLSKSRYCSIYVNDIFRYFRETELKYAAAPDFMSRQDDVNERMRAMLINWMVEVHHKFKLVPQTMYLTVNYLDRYLSKKVISRKRLQLVGCTAMLIASKYEEIYAPEVADFVYVSDHSFTRDELLNMERSILNALDFNLTFPSACVFLGRFIKVADADSKIKMLASYLVEQTLQDYPMLKYGPSMIASAALLLAIRSLSTMPGVSHWTPLLVKHTHYAEQDLETCIEDIKTAIKSSERRNLRAVTKKYSSEEYLCVASISLI